MNLLLLHNRYTPDDQDIWRTAISLGWKTQRTDYLRVEEHIKDSGCNHVRYYGNTLHAEMIRNKIPIEFLPLNEKNGWLTRLPELTKRQISMIRFETLKQPFDEDIFVKPVGDKWFEGRVYHNGESIVGGFQPDDLIYVSNIINMQDEVRCFVLDDIVLTASYYRIDKIFNPQRVSQDMIDNLFTPLVKQVRAQTSLPRGVVLDFARIQGEEWCFIEANEAYASGLYMCDATKCFEVIQASQIDKIVKVSEST
jgi:hypothetical protein